MSSVCCGSFSRKVSNQISFCTDKSSHGRLASCSNGYDNYLMACGWVTWLDYSVDPIFSTSIMSQCSLLQSNNFPCWGIIDLKKYSQIFDWLFKDAIFGDFILGSIPTPHNRTSKGWKVILSTLRCLERCIFPFQLIRRGSSSKGGLISSLADLVCQAPMYTST